MIETGKEIQSFYEKLQCKQKEIKENGSYAYGKNYKIYKDDKKPRPDNRVPIPLGKSAVTDIVGYAGRPGEIVTEYDIIGDKKEDKTTELLALFDTHNREGIENSELLTTSLSFGEAWELWYTSEELELGGAMRTPEYKILKPQECFPVYSNDLKPKLDAFLRFWEDKKGEKHCDAYYPLKSERWDFAEDHWARNPEEDTIYPYTTVPAIRFRTSMDNKPVFEAQKPIIDCLDKLVSNTQNEVDRFAALTTLFPFRVTKEFIEKFKDAVQPYIDDLEGTDPSAWPRYMEKNLSGVQGFYKEQADRLERYFHKTIKIPDMSDESFAGNASGVAIAYKLIGFEFLVSEIEIYFREGLEARFKLYKDIFNKSTEKVKWENYEQKISWKRNLPVDDEAKLRIAAMLQGLGFDMAHIIKFLPNSIVEEMTEEEIKEMLGEITEPIDEEPTEDEL